MKRPYRLLLLALGAYAGVLLANSLPALADTAAAYGTRDGITQEQAAAVPWLAWPQSYSAMVDLLGYPDFRGADADWYRRPDGGHIRIDYDGAKAINYAWEEL